MNISRLFLIVTIATIYFAVLGRDAEEKGLVNYYSQVSLLELTKKRKATKAKKKKKQKISNKSKRESNTKSKKRRSAKEKRIKKKKLNKREQKHISKKQRQEQNKHEEENNSEVKSDILIKNTSIRDRITNNTTISPNKKQISGIKRKVNGGSTPSDFLKESPKKIKRDELHNNMKIHTDENGSSDAINVESNIIDVEAEANSSNARMAHLLQVNKVQPSPIITFPII